MENTIEALEIACTSVLLALAFAMLICLSSNSKVGERIIVKDISTEWLIGGGEQNE